MAMGSSPTACSVVCTVFCGVAGAEAEGAGATTEGAGGGSGAGGLPHAARDEAMATRATGAVRMAPTI